MAGGASFLPGRTGLRKDAEPLTPPELIALRRLLRRPAAELGEYLDGTAVAKRLGLATRTVRDLAKAGEFDGDWGKAFKPAHNRLKIPVRGVMAFTEKHQARAFSQEEDR